jgi:hypothetical protein
MDLSRKPLIHDERLNSSKEADRDGFFPDMEDKPLDAAKGRQSSMDS